MLGWLVHERGIEPHIPVFDKSERTDGTFYATTSPTITKATLHLPGGKMLTSQLGDAASE